MPFANTTNIRALDLYNFFGGVGSFPIDQYYRGYHNPTLGRVPIPNITENNPGNNNMPAGGAISYFNFSNKFADGGEFATNIVAGSSSNWTGFYEFGIGSISNPNMNIPGYGNCVITMIGTPNSPRTIQMELEYPMSPTNWKLVVWRIRIPSLSAGIVNVDMHFKGVGGNGNANFESDANSSWPMFASGSSYTCYISRLK